MMLHCRLMLLLLLFRRSAKSSIVQEESLDASLNRCQCFSWRMEHWLCCLWRQSRLAPEQWPILVGKIIHPGRSLWLLTRRATGGLLLRGRCLHTSLSRNENRSKELMALHQPGSRAFFIKFVFSFSYPDDQPCCPDSQVPLASVIVCNHNQWCCAELIHKASMIDHNMNPCVKRMSQFLFALYP